MWTWFFAKDSSVIQFNYSGERIDKVINPGKEMTLNQFGLRALPSSSGMILRAIVLY
jgi:hypothetical protein